MAGLPYLLAAACFASPVGAQNPAPAEPPAATYADLADLAESAAIVAVVEVRDQAEVEPERAPGLAAGNARLYLEARTEALLAGRSALGESLVYLADVPLDAKGKAPKLKKQRFLIFADPVPGARARCSWSIRRRSCPPTRRPSSSHARSSLRWPPPARRRP
jgi:hypothetical protein